MIKNILLALTLSIPCSQIYSQQANFPDLQKDLKMIGAMTLIGVGGAAALILTTIGLQQQPEVTLITLGIVAGIAAYKIKAKINAHANRTHLDVLKESEEMLRLIKTSFKASVDCAETITSDLNEEQRLGRSYQLIKIMRALNYKNAPVYHVMVAGHYNRLIDKNHELQQRIIKLSFEIAETEREKKENEELLAQLKKTSDEMSLWQEKLLKVMTAVSNLPNLIYSGEIFSVF